MTVFRDTTFLAAGPASDAVVICSGQIAARKKDPFDVVAKQLEALAAKPSAAQDASPDYGELRSPVNDFPWFLTEIPGAIYMKKDAEAQPGGAPRAAPAAEDDAAAR